LQSKNICRKTAKTKKYSVKKSPEFSFTSGSEKTCYTGIKAGGSRQRCITKDENPSSKYAKNHCKAIRQVQDEISLGALWGRYRPERSKED
jgi:hypothetical protein